MAELFFAHVPCAASAVLDSGRVPNTFGGRTEAFLTFDKISARSVPIFLYFSAVCRSSGATEKLPCAGAVPCGGATATATVRAVGGLSAIVGVRGCGWWLDLGLATGGAGGGAGGGSDSGIGMGPGTTGCTGDGSGSIRGIGTGGAGGGSCVPE